MYMHVHVQPCREGSNDSCCMFLSHKPKPLSRAGTLSLRDISSWSLPASVMAATPSAGSPAGAAPDEPTRLITCARLVPYRGFGGDDDFVAQAVSQSAWDSGKGGSSGKGSGATAALPAAPEGPEDTNDDFCFRCGGGGELVLCDKCDRSYHLYCVDPPLESAPEGEWACPAHRPGQRGRKKELELLELDAGGSRERGMRHKPARVDATKYQIGPTALLSSAARDAEIASGSGERAGRLKWRPASCSDQALAELLFFCHRLVGSRTCSEERFDEHALSHLHLVHYRMPLAKRTLLAASRWIAGLPGELGEQVKAQGHADGELLMSVVGRAHADAGLEGLMHNIAPGLGTRRRHTRTAALDCQSGARAALAQPRCARAARTHAARLADCSPPAPISSTMDSTKERAD